jgi:ABC-type lipoprotein export system ATPase subunit/histidinol phosphatase-like PHP family hydrolase/predicted  nucleic acid-binding Zn-ribbon protein
MTSESPKTSLRGGLRRVGLDLHVHTPASHDWEGGPVEPRSIVDRAIAAGLDGIAITDHQNGNWIDRVKEAAKDTDLVVFPGVEVNNLAGATGIHLIVLFEVDATSQDIDRFLASIGALTGVGDARRSQAATEGILQVLNQVYEFHGIAVLAHCQSSKGVLAEMRGELRTKVIQHPAVLAVEATASDFYNQEKAKERKRTYDLLDGTDPVYKRKLAVFQSSDNPAPAGSHGHSLEGIGSRFTYFYVEDPICLESLRQCFIDREVRIIYPPVGEEQPRAEVVTGFPRISHVSVSSGFLDGLSLSLHSGLTTLLGPKGSGKSLLIELIRFALDQQPSQPELLRDHETKLDKRLGLYGKVTVTLVDAAGTEHVISRTYDPAHGHPYEGAEFDVAEFFPCHLLSQGQIVRLAESDEEQIAFIDSFFDFRAHQRGIREEKEALADLDKQVATQIRARKATDRLEREYRTLTERIDAIDRQLKSPIFGRYRAAQKKAQAANASIQTLAELASAVADSRNAVAAVAVPAIPDDLTDDPLVRRLTEKAATSRQAALSGYEEVAQALKEAQDEAETDRAAWLPDYQELEKEHTDAISQAGGDAAKLNQQRAQLMKSRTEIEEKLRNARLQADRLRPTVEQRNEVLSRLRERESTYTKTRQERCEWFEKQSGGKIKARVEAGSNYEEFHARLEAMKRGSYLSAEDIAAIVKNVNPSIFVRALLRYDLTRQPKDLDQVSEPTTLDSEKVVRLAEFLLGDNSYEELLALEYSVTPTDRPTISYRLPDGTYAPLDQLSTGQKCTAFLVMTLCEGETPIIVDQPEDSLDIRSIWEDMCERLRFGKRSRQFVFTTHNSSLAVASDTDKFVVLMADGRRAEVVLSGAIDGPEVREEVIELLEGGQETYFLKQRKYDLDEPDYRLREQVDEGAISSSD